MNESENVIEKNAKEAIGAKRQALEKISGLKLEHKDDPYNPRITGPGYEHRGASSAASIPKDPDTPVTRDEYREDTSLYTQNIDGNSLVHVGLDKSTPSGETNYDVTHRVGKTKPVPSYYVGVSDGERSRTATVGHESTSEEYGETKTLIRRFDKDGNEVYRHTSNDDNLGNKISAIAAKRIIADAYETEKNGRDISEEINYVKTNLEQIATDMMWNTRSRNLKTGLFEVANPSLHKAPDNYLEHAPEWHQHGIVTHSLEFAAAMENKIPEYLEEWGVKEAADTVLSERIDGVEKRQLLQLASTLHDIGKFSARTEKDDHDSDEKAYTFTDHEEHSGNIIRRYLGPRLKNLNLSEQQLEYVARCAELHFELGKVRRAAKENGGYTIAFSESPALKEAAQEIIDTNSDFALEIGMMFIADALAKSEIYAEGETDEEIESQRPYFEAELEKRHLNPALINQVLQVPVNIKIAQAYLDQWVKTQA